MDKRALRKELLAQRQAIAPDLWQTQSNQLCAQLRSSPLLTQAQTVLAYFSIRQEPDLRGLFAVEKVWGFPRCVGKTLHWHIWSPQASLPLQPRAYGILEPHPDSPMLTPELVDLLLVPAIACDQRGYRLGYGGGFYDRLLASPLWAEKPTIGIVFDQAYLPVLPEDAWDRPLTAVCTENGLFHSMPPQNNSYSQLDSRLQ
ncbi:MAG: 5-formyltetrahydrofolate cyclo-ligase [Stenomitos rutilans HA7619-LM2]|jgi:5-formyltetrahydrofolate cyclo-ligase|nr:5-formyltetrahydrofolate cyclo-ligase [Stenomitos rutilans HA7619-LM2]